jgi:hypothetical protein
MMALKEFYLLVVEILRHSINCNLSNTKKEATMAVKVFSKKEIKE